MQRAYRDALGCALPLGLPAAFTDPVARPLEELLLRFARTHGPFLALDAARRFGLSVERIAVVLNVLAEEGHLVLGEFRPDGTTREWCHEDVLGQLRRRSLAVLRREIEPVSQRTLGRFLPAWHGCVEPARGLEAVVDALGVLQGAALVASTLESELLNVRIQHYRAADLDQLCTSGEVVWIGAGALGANDGRVRLFFADQLAQLASTLEPAEPPSGAVHDQLRACLGGQGASFWGQLRSAVSDATDNELLTALWDLVWAGEVTNDSLAPLRAYVSGASRRSAKAAATRGRPRPGRLTRLGPPAGAGRWSLVAPLLATKVATTQALHGLALQLLERHGVVTREAVNAEGVVGGFSAVYGVLKVLEERGHTRRGYFIEGLGAAQFALPGAIDRLRSMRDERSDHDDVPTMASPLVLAATDPAQPYGSTLSWPDTSGRPARSAAAWVVLADGEPLIWIDRRSGNLIVFPAGVGNLGWAAALAARCDGRPLRSIEVRKLDGAAPPPDGPVAEALRQAGFVDGYRGFVKRL